MITLYQFASSPFSEKIRRVLQYKLLPYVINEADRRRPEDYLHVSPYGKFPAIDDDGHTVHDSSDIVIYLDDRYPDKLLIPRKKEEAALAHIIEDWADESLYFYEITMRASWEHNARRILPAVLPTLPAELSEEAALEFILSTARSVSQVQGIGRKSKSHVVMDVERHFRSLDTMLCSRDWLVGNSISVADISVIAQINCLAFAEEVESIIKSSPNVSSWMSRVNTLAPDPVKL
jgi:glutathione S-transferase